MANNAQPKQYEHEYDDKNPLDKLAMELERQLSEVIRDRHTIEQRMVEDLRNYHGEYDEEVKKALKDAKRSHPFIKLTRAKTNAAESQLVDLLFPNDDKNWGIEPTPAPELAGRIGDKTPVTVDGQEYQDESGNPVTESDLAERELEIIRERCLNMETEIEDQLVESSYNAKARQSIHDACVVGTGILKGPVVIGKTDRAYIEGENGEFEMIVRESFTPAVDVVRPWDFYPDMSASHISEADFVFERRYMGRQQVRDLVKRKGFPQKQVNRVLKMKPEETQHTSTYQDDVRRLAGLSDTLNDTRYETWEYHGPISNEVLFNLDILDDMPEDEDELETWMQGEVVATVFYCGGIVLGARTHLITYEGYLPYRVFNWEEDDSSIFGYGVPRMVRDEQAIINSVWRTMLDNASITAGPQIGRNRKKIKPANDEWTLEPFKQWDMLSGGNINEAFSTFEFKSHLSDLSSIYQVARVLFDEVSGVPMMQQGEQGEASQTLGGMSILMNAANTVRRRQVKMWDDNITSPIIGDFYHWNMLNSDKNDIKGDYQVDARGTGALLVRETQAFALTNFLQMAANNEVFQPVLQLKQLEIMKLWARTQQLPSDIMPTEEELRAYFENLQEQEQQSPADPQIEIEQLRLQQLQKKFEFEQQLEQQKLQAKMAEVEVTSHLKEQELAAQIQSNASKERIEMMKLAHNKEISTEKMMVELKKVQSKLDQDWSQFIAEIEMKRAFGKRGNYGLGK